MFTIPNDQCWFQFTIRQRNQTLAKLMCPKTQQGSNLHSAIIDMQRTSASVERLIICRILILPLSYLALKMVIPILGINIFHVRPIAFPSCCLVDFSFFISSACIHMSSSSLSAEILKLMIPLWICTLGLSCLSFRCPWDILLPSSYVFRVFKKTATVQPQAERANFDAPPEAVACSQPMNPLVFY